MIHFSVSLVNCYFIKYNRLAQRPRKKGAIGWFAGRSAKLLAAKWVAVAKCCKPVRNETIETDSKHDGDWRDMALGALDFNTIVTASLSAPNPLPLPHSSEPWPCEDGLDDAIFQKVSRGFFSFFLGYFGLESNPAVHTHNSVLNYNTGLLRVLCLSG